MGLEEEMTGLSDSAGLFEVNVPDYKQLKTCRKEIVLLKELWDMILLVRLHSSQAYWCFEKKHKHNGEKNLDACNSVTLVNRFLFYSSCLEHSLL